MDPTKLSGIAEWPIPAKVKDVQSFLGFTNYYRRFIGDYSNIARPLIDLTKKNQEWKWSSSCQKAFDQLKEEFSKQPMLLLPDLNKPFAIAMDTSKDASGGILLQADSNGEWHPCSYLSQSFSLLKETMTSMTENVETLPSRIPLPSKSLYQSQKPPVLQGTWQIKPKTSKMDVGHL